MSTQGQAPFFDYFQREMTYLRRQGGRFAETHPKIAARLDLGSGPSTDPHTERLIESFAFLTARLQRDIDDQIPRISAALLDTLYPHYTRPLPSLAIASFETSPQKGKLTAPHFVPKGTSIFAYSDQNDTCHFQTCYDIDLAPISVMDCEIITRRQTSLSVGHDVPNRFLRLTLTAFGGNLGRLTLPHVRFYIHGGSVLQHALYEGLFSQKNPTVCALSKNQEPVFLPAGSLKPVGFGADHTLMRGGASSSFSYGVLFDYCHFPEKFFFFDVMNVTLMGDGATTQLLISLADETALSDKDINAGTFRLGCTPIINLFPKTSEPIRLDHKSTEYRLVGDYRHEKTTEIHTVLSIHGARDDSKDVKTYAPYFSYAHADHLSSNPLFWYGRRVGAVNLDLAGTDLYLSLVDEELNPHVPQDQTIFAKTLCTNRDLPRSLMAGTLFYSDTELPTSNIVCLDRPTAPHYPPPDGASQWRLISHLSLNHLSFSGAPSSLSALKEMIRLYLPGTQKNLPPEINSLINMTVTPTVRRFGDQAWRGFVQGSHVNLVFDRPDAGMKSPFLLASVLNEFFALYAHINSFVELSATQTNREGVWKQWLPHPGVKPLL